MGDQAHDQTAGSDARCDDGTITQAEVNEELVAELLENVRRILEDERARGRSLDSKTSTLAGFSSAILALVATLGRELFRLDLGSAGDPAVEVLFVLSVLALATAVMLFVGGILRPQPRLAPRSLPESCGTPGLLREPTEDARLL